jgi:hypothetical protein
MAGEPAGIYAGVDHRRPGPVRHQRTENSVRVTATRALVAALALALLAACSSSSPASPGAGKALTIAYCGGHRQVRPTSINIICGANDITAQRLDWSGWGTKVATARGSAVVDLCSFEDCHMGQYFGYPIVVIASKPETCAPGQPGYARLQYVFVGRSPFQGLPAHLSFKHYMVGADRPGPPPNQTVSLTC